MRLPKGGLALTIFVSVTPIVNAQWIEAKSTNYSIFYQSGYERDVEFTRTWLNRAEDLLKSKYGVAFAGFHISFLSVSHSHEIRRRWAGQPPVLREKR